MRGREVHGWDHAADAPVAHAVLLPGLGLHRYVHPLARALAERAVSSTVLDLPGFAAGSRRDCPPDVRQIGAATAAWITEHAPRDRPLVIFGHSTGSLAALHAVLDLDRDPDLVGRGVGPGPALLVMAGPVFPPRQRSLIRVAALVPLAYRLDPPTELVALIEAVRAPDPLLHLLDSALRSEPENLIGGVRIPLLLIAGRADAYAPERWMVDLAKAAVATPRRTVSVLPGSHNNPFTHPSKIADRIRRELTPR